MRKHKLILTVFSLSLLAWGYGGTNPIPTLLSQKAFANQSEMSFKVGDHVDASRDGKSWLEGRVQSIQNGEYEILLDGFSGTQIYSPTQVRSLAPLKLALPFLAGDKVQIRSSKVKTTVVDFQNGRYLVKEGNGMRWLLPEDFETSAGQQQAAGEEIQRKYYATFWQDARKYETTIKTLGEAFNPSLSGYLTEVQLNAPQIKQLKAELTALSQICQSKYPGLQNPPWLSGPPANNLEQRGGDWCAIANQRDKYLPALVMLDVQRQAKKRMNITDIATDGKTTSGIEYYAGMKNGFAEFKKQLQTDMVKFDQALREAGYTQGIDWTPLENNFKQQQTNLKIAVSHRPGRLLDWNGNSADAKDPSAEQLARNLVMQREGGAKIFKTGVRTPQWIIIKNALGIPVYRYQMVVTLFSNPAKYDYCVLQQTIVRQEYNKGSYTPSVARHDAQKYVTCP